jgi:hypothetical protein
MRHIITALLYAPHIPSLLDGSILLPSLTQQQQQQQPIFQQIGVACYRLCVSGVLGEVRMNGALEHFEPAQHFIGAVPAFYFGTGPFGTG